jgi:DNA (cytosine-5)-methyltransferase 1
MKHGSLFSGIGGFDLAAEWMGWENVFHCEWNPFGQKVLKHYWPNSISYNDITKTDFTIHRGAIDILTGGFPCQPYSSAGKRLGKEDERHLWPSMLRAIREIQPRWIVGENVLGLVNWNGGMVFEEVQADLEAEGYEVQPYVLPAAAVNAPHRRDRIWFVAYRNATNPIRIRLQRWEASGHIQGSTGKTQSKGGESSISFEANGSERITPHPNRNGLNQRNGNDEEQPGKGGFNALSNADTGNEYGDASDTYNCFNKTLGQRSVLEEQKGQGQTRRFSNGSSQPVWLQFPTVSPICSRNDGLSNRLDGITFPKWRTESIKAGGNAIVPQVVLQIFKAIHIFETQNLKP